MREHNREKTIAALILAAGRSSRMQHGQESYHKLLLPLGQGTVLSHVIAATLASQARPIILILGYQSAQIRASLTQAGANLAPNTVQTRTSVGTRQAQGTVPTDPVHPWMAHTGQTDRNVPLTRFRTGASPVPTDSSTFSETADNEIIITENTAYDQGMSTSLRQGIQILTNHNNHGALILLGDQPLITPSLLNQLIEMKYTTGKRIIAPFYHGKRGNPVLFDADLFPELLTITGDEGARSVIEKHRTEVGRLAIDEAQSWYDIDTWEGYQQVLRLWQQQHQ